MKSGLTAADFKEFSIGYVIDYCDTMSEICKEKDLHKDEERYYKLKDILPFVEEKYKSGKMTEKEYNEFMDDFKKRDEEYGWHY